MQLSISYTSNEHYVSAENRRIKVSSLVPKLTGSQRHDTEKQINDALFNIFCEYMS